MPDSLRIQGCAKSGPQGAGGRNRRKKPNNPWLVTGEDGMQPLPGALMWPRPDADPVKMTEEDRTNHLLFYASAASLFVKVHSTLPRQYESQSITVVSHDPIRRRGKPSDANQAVQAASCSHIEALKAFTRDHQLSDYHAWKSWALVDKHWRFEVISGEFVKKRNKQVQKKLLPVITLLKSGYTLARLELPEDHFNAKVRICDTANFAEPRQGFDS